MKLKLYFGEIQILILIMLKFNKIFRRKTSKDWLRKIHECEDEKVLKYFLKDLRLKI